MNECYIDVMLYIYLYSDVGEVKLVEYDANPSGLIRSFVERFPSAEEVDEHLHQLWDKDRRHFDVPIQS